MRLSELEGRKVALWGLGREGRAAWWAIRNRFPVQALTLFCPASERTEAESLGDPFLAIDHAPTAEALAAFDLVIKSPGISPYAPPAGDARLLGARFTGGTRLWFGEWPGAPTICVTGTKGKSSTTALIAHLLRAGGLRTALAGNIGLPLLELVDASPAPDAWAIELSSYQAGDAVRPSVSVMLNLYPEHLDWHGSEARYYADKTALVTSSGAGAVVLNGGDPRIAALEAPGARRLLFNVPEGWHLRDTGVYRGERAVFDARALPLPGRHNRLNLCAALAAIEALGHDAAALAHHAETFRPLPHRLQSLGARAGVEFVNDSIATTPHASLAALDTFKGRPVAIIVGGYDRGLDWGAFAERIALDPVAAVITQGQNGPAIHERLKPLAVGGRFALHAAAELDEAVGLAERALGHRGVVLLSPGAPSFPRYRDYAERGRHFASCAGFDPDAISTIPGLGIA